MTRIKVKGFKIFPDRHGKERCYHRLTGTAIDLEKFPKGSAEFFAEVARIGALATVTEPKPGTLGMLINEYREHPAFTDLAPRTRTDYQRVFDYLKPISEAPLIRFDRPLVVRIRDKAVKTRGRRQGNFVKTVLSPKILHRRSGAFAVQRICPTPTDPGAMKSVTRCWITLRNICV
jgi:hypothetical protein